MPFEGLNNLKSVHSQFSVMVMVIGKFPNLSQGVWTLSYRAEERSMYVWHFIMDTQYRDASNIIVSRAKVVSNDKKITSTIYLYITSMYISYCRS